MVLLLVAVLAVKLGGGSKVAPPGLRIWAQSPVMPSLGEPAAPKRAKISFESVDR